MDRDIRSKKDIRGERRREFEAKVEALKAQYNVDERELSKKIEEVEQDLNILMKDREIMSGERRSDGARRKSK